MTSDESQEPSSTSTKMLAIDTPQPEEIIAPGKALLDLESETAATSSDSQIPLAALRPTVTFQVFPDLFTRYELLTIYDLLCGPERLYFSTMRRQETIYQRPTHEADDSDSLHQLPISMDITSSSTYVAADLILPS